MNYPNLAFNQGKEIKFVAQTEIVYCVADNNYTDIFLTENRKIVTNKTLKDLEKVLAEDIFIRIHNSYIVNLMHVVSYKNDHDNMLTLEDGTKLTVSRRKKKELLSKFYKL